MKKAVFFSVAALAITSALHDSQAQVIYWDFGTTTSATGFIPTTDTISTFNSSVISSHNLTPVDTIAISSQSSGYTVSVGDFSAAASAGGNPYGNVFTSGAFNATTSSYWEFTLTPTAGNAVNLGYFAFGARGISGESATPTSYSLRSSLDGYATGVADGEFILTSTAWRLYTETFSFTGAVDQAVTFRLYLLGADGTSRTGTLRIDDVTLSTVPEPSTYALLALGLGAVLWKIRRRQLA